MRRSRRRFLLPVMVVASLAVPAVPMPALAAEAPATDFSTSLGVCALLKTSSRGLSVTPILTSTLDPFRSKCLQQAG